MPFATLVGCVARCVRSGRSRKNIWSRGTSTRSMRRNVPVVVSAWNTVPPRARSSNMTDISAERERQSMATMVAQLGQGISREQVEDFFYYEAALLDEWRLDEWLELLTDDASYYVPSTDVPEGDH